MAVCPCRIIADCWQRAVADPDIPPPGTYDVYSPEAKYKKFGFIAQDERFRAERVDERQGGPAVGAVARSLSRSGQASAAGVRPAGAVATTAMRAEESRLKREIEYCQKRLHDLQSSSERDARVLKDKVQQAEERIKDLLRERSDISKRLLQREAELKAKERERVGLAAQLKQQQAAAPLANPKTEKQLRDNAEQASSMCAKLKEALDKARRTSEEDKRRLRQLESQLRRSEQEKGAYEGELRKLGEVDYPRQLSRAEKELREQEEHYREKARKLNVSLQEARDLASRYMNELGEATVHATALENELQLARERAQDTASGTEKQLDTAMSQLSATQRRLGDLERLAAQRATESGRLLDAANDHVEELKAEIGRLEQEREQAQLEMQGRIRELTRDYKSAKREFESSVKDADSERTKRLHDTQSRLERATKETIDLKAEVSELRGILLKKEMGWKDRQLELEGDLQAAASDYGAMQKRLIEQHAEFDARVKALEDQAQKKERAWTSERTSILEKLDAAHKDGFKLREALDDLQKDAAQTKADCEADLRRTGQEMAALLAETEHRTAQWEKERRELARSHTAELAELNEECALLEQQLNDDRGKFEAQLGDARDELAAQARAHREQTASLQAQAAGVADSLEKHALATQILEERLAKSDAKAAARIAALEESLDSARLEHERGAAELLEELRVAEQRAAECEDEAHGERMEAEALRAENSSLCARLDGLAAASEELAAECAGLQDMVDDLAEGSAQADGQRDEALSHYTGVMQALSDKHCAEKTQWKAEREAMQERLNRYKYREHMWAIQEQYLQEHLAIKEAARQHMVQEARNLFCELQDEAEVAGEQMDAGAALADDLQHLLTLQAGGDGAGLDQHLSEVRELTRAVFLESIQRAQEAGISRVRVESAVQELAFMRVQGQIVETVGDMSAQHKAERARLESALAAARSDYRGLQELAAGNCATYEAQVGELRARIGELVEPGNTQDAARLEAENATLVATVKRLGNLVAELEARLEVADYAVDDERAESDRHQTALESQNAHMNRVLEQCEVDMAAQVEQISAMGQFIAELESERAIMAEQTRFQINWLKENYSKAYQDLDTVLSNGGGHSNLQQRIRYVESLKTQILTLKRECFEASRDRDRFRHNVSLLKSELGAYKEVSDVDAARSRIQARGRPTAQRSGSVSRRALGAGTEPAADASRTALGMKGAAVARKALEDARQLQHQQMTVADE
ncbi:hypothetical protein LPJ61_000313 [Coemansia biformis]|uniref:Hyaluronan-mediated motility receptor C-terminal domain-containing protein n=1 Tax=Coemansia biformis TaxID=1286918 RepID=A0A9W7YGF9_9FUNG|nr:hypothetical protein LPJ61_000313 [Coemansia biformis]